MPKCRGICDRFKVKKPNRKGSMYSYAKRCRLCAIWVARTHDRCPCCKVKLKSVPSYTYQKKALGLIKA